MSTEFDWNAMSPLAMWRDWLTKSEGQRSESMSKMLKDPKARGQGRTPGRRDAHGAPAVL